MTRLFANLTLSTKILLATGGTLVLVVAIACALVVADHYQDANARLLAEATTQAEVIAANAAPAIAARDRFETERMLGALQAAPAVLAARVYDDSGTPFSDYQTARSRRLGLELEQASSAVGARFHHDYLEVYRPILLRGKRIGMLAMATDLTSFRYDFVGFGIKAVLIALVALVVAYLLTAAANRAILEPIGSLTTTVRRAFDEKRDDLRAHVRPGDEAGVLAEAFNALLERILDRETSLRRELAERSQAQRRLDELAHYDPVTKLPNRHFFLRQLERVLLEAAKAGSAGALLLIDLNKLKQVNDSLGHDAGDSLLRQFAKRLAANLRDNDVLCRLGGDQFALIVAEISGESHLVTVANKLLAIVRQPVTLGEREITVSSSIGIAVFPVDGNEPQVLLRHAETALHRAKAAGKNNHLFFSPDMLDRDNKWINVSGELQRALENGELRLHLQPQVFLGDGKIRGLEALLRWQHPQHGLLLPGEFMQLAEDNPEIMDGIANWTLEAACAQIAAWRGAAIQPVPIALNFSAAQLRDKRVARRLHELLARYEVPAEFLEIEIAENLLMSEPGAGEVLDELRKLGSRVMVDHFGAGYSSLIQLKDLPVTGLKIDREFVHGIAESAKYASITRAIVSLASEIGLDTVAEGVESTRQVEFLRTMGCRAYQGFCFSPAVPSEEAARFLIAQAPPIRLAFAKG
jgi:diguanylate cyclase (GGDEF)-like protein